MSGAPPYGLRSPSSQQTSSTTNYNQYSPPPKNNAHPYYSSNDQYQQHPPETPQPYASSYTQSPHYNHAASTSPRPPTLPPLNGASSHSDAPPSSYPAPNFQLPRVSSTPHSAMSDNRPSSYGSSHSHPPPPASHLLSPKKEPDTSYRGNSSGYSSHSPVTKEAVSQFDTKKKKHQGDLSNQLNRNLLAPRIPCPLPAFFPSQQRRQHHDELRRRRHHSLPDPNSLR